MALSDDQKLDLIIRAYAEGYKGDFQELFDMADRETSPDPELPVHTSPRTTPQAIDYEKQKNTTLGVSFDDARAKQLVKSYDTKQPGEMPLGEPVNILEETNYYKKGGFKLNRNIPHPRTPDVNDYVQNYTGQYLYEHGGPHFPSQFDFTSTTIPFRSNIPNDADFDGLPIGIDRADVMYTPATYSDLEKGISWVESKDGRYMINPEEGSTATGLYGQRFSEIKSKPNKEKNPRKFKRWEKQREKFSEDIPTQQKYFRDLVNRESGLIDSGNDLFEAYYYSLLSSEMGPHEKNYTPEFPYTPTEIAAMRNMLGRQGTRKYLGNVLRDGKSLSEVFPNLYGPKKEVTNKTPDEYIKEFNIGVNRKSK